MLKKILVLSSIMFSYELVAQHDVTYDFIEADASKRYLHSNTDKTDTRKTVDVGEICTFTIKNVNTFIYDVSINGEVVDLHSEPPAAFTLFFKALSLIATAAKINDTAEAPPKKTKAADRNTNPDPMANYTNAVRRFRGHLANLEAWKAKYDNVLNICHTDGKSGDAIIKQVRDYMKADTSLIIIDGMKHYDSTMTALEDIFAYLELLDASEKIEKKDDRAELKILRDKIKAFDYSAFFERFNILCKQAINPNTYMVISSPVIAEGDYINFIIKISPRKDVKYAQQLKTFSFEYPVHISQNFKVDFSTGVFFAFGDAKGTTYRLEPIPNDPLNVKIARNNPRASAVLPSIGAAMHGSWRCTQALALGGTLGLGLNGESIINPNFYLGASGIFGWRERIVFTAGCALTYVDYISTSYSPDQIVAINSVKQEDLTEKTYRAGLFLSLTYNLTNKKKGQ